MKVMQYLSLAVSATTVHAIAETSIMSTARNAAVVGFTIAKEAACTANIRAGMMTAAEKSRELVEAAPGVAGQAAGWIAQNPGTSAGIVVGAVLVAGPAIVAAPALGAAGFTASGVASGSLAATAQSGIGSVVAPSLFATLQSAGAGGYGVPLVYGAVQAAGGTIMGATGGAAAWFKSKL